MKKEIYASWCSGLSQDKKALAILKNSKIISGVEICQLNEEIELIKNYGLKVSIHNPLRDLHVGLEDRNFKKEMTKERITMCKKCDTSFMGFHAFYKFLFVNKIVFLSKIRAIRNIKFLKENMKKKIIFESPPYLTEKSLRKRRKITSPKFIEKMLNHADGYLFDVSHNFITMNNLAKEGNLEYEKEILRITKGKVFEMHLNCPTKMKDGSFLDQHTIFTGREYEDEFLDFVKKVLKNNPKIEIINLEMTTNATPEEHAKILVQQAKYLKKKLKI